MICPGYGSESVPILNWIEASALGETQSPWLLTSTAIRAATTEPPEGAASFRNAVGGGCRSVSFPLGINHGSCRLRDDCPPFGWQIVAVKYAGSCCVSSRSCPVWLNRK